MGYKPSPVAWSKPLQLGDHSERRNDTTDITTTMEEDPDDFSLLNLREVQLSEPFASIYVVLSEESATARIHLRIYDLPRCS